MGTAEAVGTTGATVAVAGVMVVAALVVTGASAIGVAAAAVGNKWDEDAPPHTDPPAEGVVDATGVGAGAEEVTIVGGADVVLGGTAAGAPCQIKGLSYNNDLI